MYVFVHASTLDLGFFCQSPVVLLLDIVRNALSGDVYFCPCLCQFI